MNYFRCLPLLVLVSCTATKLTSSWTSPQAGASDYKKLMVVSIIDIKDTTIQRKMESHFVHDLQGIGYNAIGYRDVFREGELKNMRYDSVRRKLTEKGIDGVITIHLMGMEKESVYVKDKVNNHMENSPLGGFWQSPITTVKQNIGKPGYYLTSTSYYWESNFYDVNSIALLYNARSEAFEVVSMENLAHKYGKMIVNDMQKNYVLSTKQ
ncbi:MAG: hypothetical protein EON98_00235 [Chitinophagaceae bacterium]|nr:MAG: hypothetical protein EON98_00235 [Chitinophagaceae bacterium]